MERFFNWSLTILLLLATLMECLQVLLRYVFQTPSIWLDETIIFPAIWLYMLGSANASREDTQITAKILPDLFPGQLARAIFDFLARLFSSIISFWLTSWSLDYFLYSIEANRKTGYLFFPLYIGETAIAGGLILMSWYCVVRLKHSLSKLSRILQRRKPC